MKASASSFLFLPQLLAIASVAVATGCSANVDGTGDRTGPGRVVQNPAPGDTTETSPSTPEPTASGAPVEIEALFAPPESDTATPDSIFGVWAARESSSGTEERLKITATHVTIAKRCKGDGRIASVTAKVRASESKITVLESKTAQLAYPSSSAYCTFTLNLDVGEWVSCGAGSSYECFSLYGTQMQGLHSTMSSAGVSSSWLKLSD